MYTHIIPKYTVKDQSASSLVGFEARVEWCREVGAVGSQGCDTETDCQGGVGPERSAHCGCELWICFDITLLLKCLCVSNNTLTKCTRKFQVCDD